MFGLIFIGLVMFVNTIFEKGICLENMKNTNIKVPVIVSVIIVILGRKSNIGEIKHKSLCEICEHKLDLVQDFAMCIINIA